jgi:hypothetical protein
MCDNPGLGQTLFIQAATHRVEIVSTVGETLFSLPA